MRVKVQYFISEKERSALQELAAQQDRPMVEIIRECIREKAAAAGISVEKK